ncbi:HTH-type transcriptional repressor KstR2 [bacterium BMS3Bbin02]|nr:HTH-type transcriptional repressor KstR2 [bacterium BMS3Bbin02]
MTVVTTRYSEIVDIASRLFATKGYGATSIQDIADEVGMLKGSLYHHISGKQALLEAVIQGVHDSALHRLAEARARTGSPIDTLTWFVTDHVLFNIVHRDGIRVYFEEFRSLDTSSADRIWQDRLAYDRFVKELVANAQDAGEADPTLDPHAAAVGILSLMNWVYQWYRPDSDTSAADVAATIACQAVRLITPRRKP